MAAASPAKETAAATKIQAAFKGHDVRKGALNLAPKQRAVGSMTLKRQDHAAMELNMRAMECSQWIGNTVGVKPLTDAKDQNEFFKLISDGVALCQLIEKIDKSLGITFRANAKVGSFPARDNIVNFVDACKKLGVNAVTLFDPEDLVGRKHDKQVVNCLLQLAKIAAVKYKITPPSIVQYELEIEELEKKRKAGTLKEDEDDLDEDETQTTSRAASGSVIAPPSPAAAPADSKTAAAAVPELPATAEAPAAAPAKEAEPKAAPAAEAAASAPAKEAEAEPAADAAKGTPKKDNKPKYKYLPYVPAPDSEIDTAVAKVLNNNLFDIDVKPVDIKKKKRSRTAKQLKAEYMVSGHRVHVRKIQGVVMVHVGADWISFARFAEDIVMKSDS